MIPKPFILTEINMRRHLLKGIILDTKLFVLFLGGIYDYEGIGKNKLTKNFVKEDFDLIKLLIEEAKWKIIITPHILAESSNFIRRDMKDDSSKFFIKVLEELKKSGEFFIKKDEILSTKEFLRFGVADIGIIKTYEHTRGLVLTTDGNLEREYSIKGLPIINFNNLRPMYWNKNK